MKEQDFEWLMFDFDNTLVDFHEASKLAFDQCFEDFNIELKSEYYPIYEAINGEIWSAFERKEITAIDIRKTRFTRFLKHIGIVNLDGLEFNTQYLNNLVKFTKIRIEVVNMLKRLKGQYKLSIITNGLREVQRPRLDICTISEFFDSIIVSDEIGVAKPDSKFFDFAMATLNEEIPKEKILVIGDSLISDIAGAKNYGLKSCFINTSGKDNIESDIIIEDVLQLETILNDTYMPVDCGWYDHLEIYAMRKNDVAIEYNDGEKTKNIISQIVDLQTVKKEEYATISDGTRIRLDRILSLKLIK